MAKELASHKLTQDLDVDEGELTRLARVGCVNKDDVIGTLTRSLMMRNRAYKELMARCNELGMGESKALRKSEKAIERIKQLKARVQQLEKCIEVKENRDLHHSRASSFPGRQDLNSSCDLLQNLSQRQNITRGSKSAVAVEPLLDITDSDRDFLSHGVLGARIYLDKVKQMSMSGSKKFGSTSVQDDDMQIFNFTETAEVEHELGVDKTVQVTDCDVENDSRKDSGGSLDVVSEHKADNPIESLLSLTIRNERRALVGSAAAPESHPFRKLAKEVSGGNKWCKQSAFTLNVHNGGGDLSSGTYISFGANGRGGQVKVLKPPPMLKIGGNPSQTLPRPVKRCKSLRTAQHAGNRQGALQIEHFFGSSAT